MTKEEILNKHGWLGGYSIHSSTQLQLESIYKAMEDFTDHQIVALKEENKDLFKSNRNLIKSNSSIKESNTRLRMKVDLLNKDLMEANKTSNYWMKKCFEREQELTQQISKEEKTEETKPTNIAGYQIDWKTKTVSVPQGVQMYCNNIYKTLEDTAKKLGLKIQLSI